MKMRDLPTPEQILEELADKTAAHMDRRANVAFDGALREMTRYHRFLLALNASRTPDGASFSFAEVAGDAWNKPHRDWVKQYSRLFERAADHIPDDGHYLRSLAYIPLRILPGPNDPGLPPDVTNGILDLGPMMMHRLEAWVTKRTVLDTPEGESAEPRLSLSGTDARAYENLLPALVGAWESLLERAPNLYNWGERRQHADLERWDAFRESWPFLWQHLKNTAYCLAVAVWNEDEVGASLFREALVRWPQNFRFALNGDELLPSRRYLFPDVMTMDWLAASSRATPFAYEHMHPVTPDQIFSNVIRGAHADVLHLTAGLLLFWTVNTKQTSDIGGRTAWALLNRVGGRERHAIATPNGIRFRSLFLDMLRFEIAGNRYAEGSYAGELDRLVETLDRMTERRVVPGRIYTPSTSHGREDILISLTALLAATMPETGDESFLRSISNISEDEKVLPGGDESLRAIVREFENIQSLLKGSSDQLERAISVLAPEIDTQKVIDQLYNTVGEARDSIEDKRRERLHERPVSLAKLERIRADVQVALLENASNVPFFRNVGIEKSTHEASNEIREAVFSGIDKAVMVEPTMASPALNFYDVFQSGTLETAAADVWEGFKRRPRIHKSLSGKFDEERFWKEITGLVDQIGPDPILLVSRSVEGRALRSLLNNLGEEPSKLKIERRPRNDAKGLYIATIEGVEVFEADVPIGVAWLFSGQMLRRIRYAELDNQSHYVGAAFEFQDQDRVKLKLRFSQQFVWMDEPIFEIIGPTQDKIEETRTV